MFVIIFMTSLLTFIVLVITSASYLISLVCNESDDGTLSDSLAIDAHDFSTTPTASPVSNFTNNDEQLCENPKHHHGCNRRASAGQAHVNVIPEIRTDDAVQSLLNHKLDSSLELATQNLVESNDQQPLGTDININAKTITITQPNIQTLDKQLWIATPTAQKNTIISQLGAPASKQLFDDFDAKEILLGGTGLHWCKTRKSLDKLIQLGVPLNVCNSRQETALHVAIRKRKLQVLIGLLCNDAQLECKNEQGDTPLLLASKLNDIFACQVLLVFDADYDVTDKVGFSARHYVAASCERHKGKQPQPQLPSASHLILAMLHEIGAKRCSQTSLSFEGSINDQRKQHNNSCTDGCAASGSYDGNSYNRWPDFRKESLYKRHMFLDIIEEQKSLTGSERPQEDNAHHKMTDNEGTKKSRLLCIDGGGMRGVITCQILIEIQKYLKKPILSYFDWVGGTSVGAYLSCALSIGTSLYALRRNCFDVKDEVFCGTKPYSSKFLERVLKRTFGPTTRMSDAKDRKLAVTTVLADRDPCQLRFFRNYMSPANLLESHGYSAEWFNSVSNHSTPLRRQLSTLTKSLTSKTVNPKQLDIPASPSIALGFSNKLQNKRTTVKETTQSNPNTNTSTAQENKPLNEDNSKAMTNETKSDSSIDYVIDENEQDPLMWQAVRASGAAPFFFKPYGPYLDGGIISNNPTMDMLAEFFSYQKVNHFLQSRTMDDSKRSSQSIERPQKLDLVVSLGTGRGRVIGRQAMIDFGNVASGFATVFSPVELLRSLRAARDLFKKLMQQSCQTEDHILDRAQAWCASLNVPYFRVNPPLASIFSIDDKRDEQLINALWQTKLYMRAMKGQLEELGALLEAV